jgi:hypothetical protein
MKTAKRNASAPLTGQTKPVIPSNSVTVHLIALPAAFLKCPLQGN